MGRVWEESWRLPRLSPAVVWSLRKKNRFSARCLRVVCSFFFSFSHGDVDRKKGKTHSKSANRKTMISLWPNMYILLLIECRDYLQSHLACVKSTAFDKVRAQQTRTPICQIARWKPPMILATTKQGNIDMKGAISIFFLSLKYLGVFTCFQCSECWIHSWERERELAC